MKKKSTFIFCLDASYFPGKVDFEELSKLMSVCVVCVHWEQLDKHMPTFLPFLLLPDYC